MERNLDKMDRLLYTQMLSQFKRDLMDKELQIIHLKQNYISKTTVWRLGDRAQIVNPGGRGNHGTKVYIRGIDVSDDGKIIFSLRNMRNDGSQGRKEIKIRYDEHLKKISL